MLHPAGGKPRQHLNELINNEHISEERVISALIPDIVRWVSVECQSGACLSFVPAPFSTIAQTLPLSPVPAPAPRGASDGWKHHKQE